MSDSSDAFNEKKLSQYARRGELSDAEVQFMKTFDKKKWKKAIEAVEKRLKADEEARPPDDPPAKWTEAVPGVLAFNRRAARQHVPPHVQPPPHQDGMDSEEGGGGVGECRGGLMGGGAAEHGTSPHAFVHPQLYPPAQWRADNLLWEAAINGDNRAVLRAVREEGAAVNSSNPAWRHYRAVHYAAVNDRLSTLVVLVSELAADVDPWDAQLYTPMLRAAQMGSLQTVKLLVALGADTRLRTSADESALDIALLYNFPQMYTFLEKCVGREDDLASEEESEIDESKVNLEGWLYDIAKKLEKNKRAWNFKLQRRLEAGIGAPLPGSNGTRNHEFPWGRWQGGCSETA